MVSCKEVSGLRLAFDRLQASFLSSDVGIIHRLTIMRYSKPLFALNPSMHYFCHVYIALIAQYALTSWRTSGNI
eukprot:763363-Hanusia_phi.AAC.1